MPLGPVELLVVKFPGSQFRGEIVPALADIVDRGMIRIIDIAFVSRDQSGVVTITELSQLEDAEMELFDALISDVSGLIAQDDIYGLAAGLEAGSSAAMLLYEMPWARDFAEALRNANAEIIERTAIPHDIVELAAEAALAFEAEALAELESGNGQLVA
jgi:uncharacterized membrane protein